MAEAASDDVRKTISISSLFLISYHGRLALDPKQKTSLTLLGLAWLGLTWLFLSTS